jgi:hypothetical protein
VRGDPADFRGKKCGLPPAAYGSQVRPGDRSEPPGQITCSQYGDFGCLEESLRLRRVNHLVGGFGKSGVPSVGTRLVFGLRLFAENPCGKVIEVLVVEVRVRCGQLGFQ